MSAITILALGTGPLFALGTGIVVGSAPPERAGSAAAMSETSNYLGGTLGLAVLGTVGAAIYRHHMADAIPADVTAEAAHNARESVAGATATDLSGVDATDLIHAAHGAFTSGINTIGLIGGAIFIVLAILIATRLR